MYFKFVIQKKKFTKKDLRAGAKRTEQAFTERYIAINLALQYAANKFSLDNIDCILVLPRMELLVLWLVNFRGIQRKFYCFCKGRGIFFMKEAIYRIVSEIRIIQKVEQAHSTCHFTKQFTLKVIIFFSIQFQQTAPRTARLAQ